MTTSQRAAAEPDVARVEPGRGQPFGLPEPDVLAARGYVMQEFIASGTARRYELAPGAQVEPDGRWTSVARSAAPRPSPYGDRSHARHPLRIRRHHCPT
jgi:Alpha/beta hydrolase domain